MRKILVIILLLLSVHVQAQEEAVLRFNDLKEITKATDVENSDVLENMYAFTATIKDGKVYVTGDILYPFVVLFLSKDDFIKLHHISGVVSFTNSNILYDEPFFYSGVRVQKVMIREDWYMDLEDDSFVMKDILTYLEKAGNN